jgi:RNA polymerase sigma factor (sigma-70 family)
LNGRVRFSRKTRGLKVASGKNFRSDDELLGAIRAGDEGARKHFYEKYSRLVAWAVRQILQKCDHREDVEGLTWDRIFKRNETLKDTGRLRNWIVRVAQNEALRHLEKEHKGQPEIIPLTDCQQLPEARIVGTYEQVEAAERLSQAVSLGATYAPEFPHIFELRCYGFTFEEIGELMGMSPDTVKNIYYRVIHRLKINSGGRSD